MINRKLPAVCLLAVLCAAIIPGRIARSDGAPPRVPSGSNVVPGQETKVRMLAENVLLWILKGSDGAYHAEVTADFRFRNQGAAAESMQVRFPMEDVDGGGDRFGNHPLIRNFSAQADGATLPIQNVSEPFQNGPAIQWSTFPVAFPVGRNVLLRVRYETDLMRERYSVRYLEYILETGAGWYGTIGSAVITYRFPYAVSEVNAPIAVSQVDNPNPPHVVRVGKEVRVQYTDFEPDSSFNIFLEFADPAVWQSVLDLESYTGDHPQDIPSILQLAETYVNLCGLNPDAALLAETIVEEALTYSPDSADLHAEWAYIYAEKASALVMSMCYPFTGTEAERSQDIAGYQRELKRALELDPQNAKVLELQKLFNPDLPGASTPAVPATEVATTQAPEESSTTPAPTPTAQSTLLPIADGNGSGTNDVVRATSAGISAGWLVVAGIVGLAAGILFAVSWKVVRSVFTRTKPGQ